MPELVTVSSVEKKEQLKTYVEELFSRGKYAEITQAIGMHSILIDPEHMISDQSEFYHVVLRLVKERMLAAKGKNYSAWYADFPNQLDKLVASSQVVTDQSAAQVLASHRSAVGPFKSLDEFFFWALDDRRLPLGQIIQYIDKTAGTAAA
jgi:hypothetical protein